MRPIKADRPQPLKSVTVYWRGRKMVLMQRPQRRLSLLLCKMLRRSMQNLFGTLSRKLPGAAKRILSAGALAAMALASATTAHATAITDTTLPTDYSVKYGQVGVSTTGSQMAVTIGTDKAIINWGSFSIGSAAGVNFNFTQANAGSSVLNRVIGNDPSVIMGSLTSNGKVFLINAAGILVGKTATINLPSFIASTLNISDSNFLAGNLMFDATPGATAGVKIEKDGSITTPEGGSVYLLGATVENEGIITAPGGEILLAAGSSVQLVDTGTPGVTVNVTGAEGKVTNLGQIMAAAGTIGIGAALIDNSGVINASSVTKVGGRIFLRASQNLTTGATSSINADGTVGGNVVLYSDQSANIDGDVSALGNVDGKGGKGGFVDTSGKSTLSVKYVPRVGPGGEWYIDPDNITITDAQSEIGGAATGNSSDSAITATQTGTIIHTATITGLLNAGTNVSIVTGTSGDNEAGDITVNADIVKSAGTRATLKLDAANNIVLNSNISSSGVSAGMDLVLIAAGGAVTQPSGSLAVNTLNVTAAAGITLNNATNVIGALTASNTTGDISVTTSGGALTLNSVSAANGNISISSTGNDIQLAGNLSANGTGKTITLAAAAGMLQTGGVISTGQLSVSAGIDIDLQSVGNNVGSFTGATPVGHISLNNTGNLTTFGNITVGAAKAVNLTTVGNLTVGGLGITAQAINLTATAPSASVPVNIAVGGQLTATGAVSLHTANGTITQTAIISTGSLDVIAGAGITLGASNVMTGFSGSNSATGNIALNNSGTQLLTLGPINNDSIGGVTMTTAGALSTTGTIFSNGTVAMTAAGALNVGSAAVTAKQIGMTTTGSADHGIVIGGPMTATDSAGTGVTLTSAGAVTLGNIAAHNLTVVAANGAVAQMASTILNVSNLTNITATSGITLDQTANMLNFVRGSNSAAGDIVVKTSSGVLHPFALTNTAAGGNITIEALLAAIIASSGDGQNGAISANGVLTMTAGGSLSEFSALSGSAINLTAGQGNDIQLFGNLAAAGGTVRLTTDGAIIQNAGGITANVLNAQAATGITLNSGSNNVGAFIAQNDTSGDIALTNASSTLSLNGTVRNNAAAGNVTIVNTGNITGVPVHDGGGNVTNGTFANNKVTLTSTTGNVTLALVTATNLDVNAVAGSIGQDQSNKDILAISGTMNARAKNGIAIDNHANVTGLNHITNFNATNSTSGNITLVNQSTGELSNKLIAISNGGGNIFVDNTGAMETVGQISAPAGSVTLATHSPLTIGAGGISAGTGVSLAAGDSTSATDVLTLNGPVRTVAGVLTLTGNTVVSNYVAPVISPPPTPTPVVPATVDQSINTATNNASANPDNTALPTITTSTASSGSNNNSTDQSAGGGSGEFGGNGKEDDKGSGTTKSNKPLPVCS